MKYIDAKTQQSLKQGIMEFLGLSSGEMMLMFMSIYEDTEKENIKKKTHGSTL